MPRADKVAVVEQVRERLRESTATLLTEYRGLTVDELAELRAQLRDSEAEYKVVKNTLARLAVQEAGLEVPEDLLMGPTAITFCAGDPIAAAKVLRNFSKDHPDLVIKAGILEGRYLDASETLKLADLESREDLLARFAGMLGALLAQPARLAQANLVKVARLFAALQDKKPAEAEEPTAEEPAVEEPAVEEPAVEEPAVEEPAVEEPTAEDAASATEDEPQTTDLPTKEAEDKE